MTTTHLISRRGFLGGAAGLGASLLSRSLATNALGQTQSGEPPDDGRRQIVPSMPPGRASIRGPLRVAPRNPHYFTDDSGRSVYLAGVAVHGAFQSGVDGCGFQDGNNYLDYPALLEFMTRHHLNLLKQRIWENGWCKWSHAKDRFAPFTPTIYKRTGPGVATDGGLKFDLDRFVLTPQSFGIRIRWKRFAEILVTAAGSQSE
jgi:hypothetical protein